MTVAYSLKELNQLIRDKTAQAEEPAEPHVTLARLIDLRVLMVCQASQNEGHERQ